MSNINITISGNICTGKTTLTKYLSEEFKYIPYFENPQNNPYLFQFYNNKNKWSFKNQLSFLSTKAYNIIETIKNNTNVIIDRSIYEDAEIFAESQYNEGYISDIDWQIFSKLYSTISYLLPPPTMLIYLECDTALLYKRIKKRGYWYESEISYQYLDNLNLLYKEWINKILDTEIIVIKIDADDHLLLESNLAMIKQKILHEIDKN